MKNKIRVFSRKAIQKAIRMQKTPKGLEMFQKMIGWHTKKYRSKKDGGILWLQYSLQKKHI